ncbi:serine/threonine-protein kinase [Corynebacterium striatum]|uniref:serine/threonine-protein kinase n=1 Tax=Corynebacterium striatum TaxID=43770 RepID=UPI003B598ED4
MNDSRVVSWLERQGYVNVRRIGGGGMGTVFAATDIDLGRNVAIKTVLPELHNEEGLKRFHNEMKALAAIHSSYVTHINKKLADNDGNLGFEMELFEGGTLEELIRERRHNNEPGFSISDVVKYLRPVAKALDQMHSMRPDGWIHRDVKPANILLRRRPTDSGYSVLSDFGIAISEGQSRLTAIGNVIGTENYSSPESNSRDYSGQEVSFSGDNYALALIAFEMLTMYHLKEMMPDSAWRAKRTVPAMGTPAIMARLDPQAAMATQQIDAVMERALDNTPYQRYSEACQFIDALEACGKGGAELNARSAVPESQATNYPASGQLPAMGFGMGSAHNLAGGAQNWSNPAMGSVPSYGGSSNAPFRSGINPGASMPSARPVQSAQLPQQVQSARPAQPARPAQLARPQKDNNNALMITATILIILAIAVTTIALVTS